MASVFGKLQLRDQDEILVLNAPASFETELAALSGVRVVRAPGGGEAIGFALAFVQTREQVDAAAEAIVGKARGDVTLWFAYPKGSSKRYKASINRDTGWEALGRAGFEPVRQVAIDEDWTALRFRRVEHIKRLTRHKAFALSEEGKARAEE